MAGDFTRRTFTPGKDHSGVLMQQGRVTLDADFNEYVEIVDRRLRAEVVDMLGRCVFSRETPNAFLIGLSGGALTIGRGRAYVDGLLAENHGGKPFAFDAVVGELCGSAPLDYTQQPYHADPSPPSDGTYVVYLDVWRREVSYLEDPDLLEKAIAVDTAARAQSAWQVKLLRADKGTTCDSPVKGWDALVAPSAGRLTTRAVGVPVSTDPCTIPPSGGYRGTENRLYRVEVHDPGPLGTATFKWSRDNASVAAHVGAIDAAGSELTVTRLGRDGVQRIKVDDWVEVLDDRRELAGEPGELRKVAAVDEVRDAMTLSAPLTAGEFDATDTARHTRVIHWDQTGADVDAGEGLLTVPAGAGSAIVLEDGVQVSFSSEPAAGELHTGDHWVFAARTADASVEDLTEAPPLGIHHHYCRLAVATFPDSVTDCRTPPADDGGHDCSCDVCVTPESHAGGTMTIQHAVDTVRARGGKVCLAIGLYRLDRPVLIRAARSVEIEGKGLGTIIVTDGGAPFVVERSLDVTIDRLTIVTGSPAKAGGAIGGTAILLRNTIGTVIERCALLQLGLLEDGDPQKPDVPPAEPGTPAELDCVPEALRSGRIASFAPLFGPKSTGSPLIALDGLVVEARIRENTLVGTTGIGWLGAELFTPVPAATLMRGDAQAAARRYLMTFDLEIEDNLCACWLTGVSLEGFVLSLGDTRIAGNRLLVCLRAGIAVRGMTGPGGRIDAIGNSLRVLGNGIVAADSDTRIAGNDIGRLRGLGVSGRDGSLVSLASAGGAAAERALATLGGAAILLAPGLTDSPIERCMISGNRAFEMAGRGVAIETRLARALIAGNQLERLGGEGIAVGPGGLAEVLAIEGNQVRDVGLRDGEQSVPAGILVRGVGDAVIAGNLVEDVGTAAKLARRHVGIAANDCASIRITGNTVARIAPPDEFLGLSAGIAVLDPFERADVLDNGVRRNDGEPPPDPRSDWVGVLVGARAKSLPLETSTVTVGDRRFHAASGLLLPSIRGGGSLAVRGNAVDAYGTAPAVRIDGPARSLFAENRCRLAGAKGIAAAHVGGGAVIASNNHLDAVKGGRGLELGLPDGAPFTVLGNIAAGGIFLNGSALPAPWHELNIST
jgi:Family of unknown function (DUF6519)